MTALINMKTATRASPPSSESESESESEGKCLQAAFQVRYVSVTEKEGSSIRLFRSDREGTMTLRGLQYMTIFDL